MTVLTLVLFLLGFAALIKGADLLVEGASSIARRLRVSDIAIGLTIVAFGTSMPELFVNLFAAYNGTPDIAFGNVIGSNIANILLILGISATIGTLTVSSNTTWKEIPLGLLAIVVAGVLANDILVSGGAENALSRGDGIALVAFFVIFLYYTFGLARSADFQEQEDIGATRRTSLSVGMIGLGLAGLVIGGKWIVDGATAIALSFGLTEALIGLTIVAVGTSLPELATSAIAAWKGKSDIAIGNVAGSNVFNIFWILGASAVIAPLPFNPALNFDIAVATASTALLFAATFVLRRGTLGRAEGITFIILYVLYTAYLVMRG